MRRAARTLAWASAPGTAMERDLDPSRTLLWGVLLSLIACASGAIPPAPLDVTAFREAVLTRAAAGESDPKTPAEKAFKWVKEQTAYAYYTSKIGIHQEMEYKGNSLLVEFVGEIPR